MKTTRRILSIFLAVVLFVTAVLVMPEVPKTQAYSTTNTNSTWNSSYHSLVDGKGDSATPGYTSQYAYDLKQDDNEYTLTDQFAITSFNDCELLENPHNTNQKLIHEANPTSNPNVETGCIEVDGNIRDTRDGGTKAYYSGIKTAFGTNGTNMITSIYNYNGIDITDYSYFRFRFYKENVAFTRDDSYIEIMAYNNTSNAAQYRVFTQSFTNDFINNSRLHMLVDISQYSGTIYRLDIHVRGIKRSTADATARIYYDNFRFIKNTTHTEYFAYQPKGTKQTFHDCNTKNGVLQVQYRDVSPSVYYDIQTSTQANTYFEGRTSVRIQPDNDAYDRSRWYNIAFVNSQGVIPADYDYFRVYFHFGEANTARPSAFKINFSTSTDYNGTASNPKITTKEGFTIANYLMSGTGWYMITMRCDDITDRIKSISLQFGDLTIPNPGNDQAKAAIHIDDLHFIKYTYEPMTQYTYLSGHYKLLEGFEGAPDNYSELALLSSAVRKHDIDTEVATLKKHGWYETYPQTGTNNKGEPVYTRPLSGIPYNGANQQGMYAPQREHTVTQGQKACWWRPTTNNATSSWVEYDLHDTGTVDLSKFTHFSFDMAIRNPQLSSGSLASQPGLKSANRPTFRITLIDQFDTTTDLDFRLERVDGSSGFVSSGHGVEAFPLEGFIPGYGNDSHGELYTATGCMRILFTLGDLTQQQKTDFDITQVKSFRLMQHQNTKDSRNTDLFLDNLVAFTPDMTLNIQNTNPSETDKDQRFVYTVEGHDVVTNHVNIEFSMEGNTTEVIEHIPLNGYTVTQYPWSWRYAQEKKLIINAEEAPTRNGINPNGVIKQAPYSSFCRNSGHRIRTITFTQTRHHNKWLTGQDYDVQ